MTAPAPRLGHKTSAAAVADYAASVTFADLPREIRDLSKLILLDSIGAAVAASTIGAGCDSVIAFARTAFGPGASAIWGHASPASPLGAAFANGALVHALNYDALGAGYAGLIAPAVLAAADCSSAISGSDILTALVVGAELSARLQAATAPVPKTYDRTLDGQLQSYFGCALAAARIMKLPPRQIHDALGLALMQAAGSMQVTIDGDPPAKAVYGAFPCQGGVQSALLARHGLAAPCDVFEGRSGLLRVHYGDGCEAAAILTDLGAQFHLQGLRFKPWPTSGALYPLIDAAIGLRADHRLHADDIVAVQLATEPAQQVWFEPAAVRRAPDNAAAAANSGMFALAKALANGAVTLNDFTMPGLQQPGAIRIAKCIDARFDTAFRGRAHITVETGRGARYERTADSAAVPASSRMTPQAVREKFKACIAHAANPQLGERADDIIAMIANLESVGDYRELSRLFA